MIFYTVRVEDAPEGEEAYPTLDAAIEVAREEGTSVERIATARRIGRAELCAVFNRRAYAAERKTVWTAPARRREGGDG